MFSTAGVAWDRVGVHALLDVVLLGVLVGLAYPRGRRNGDTVFVLVGLNLGLFATLVAVSGDSFTSGAGFGLFGMLSLIRLRSASLTSLDMTYAFVALVVGLVMGLVDLSAVLGAVLAGGLVAVVLVGERVRRRGEVVSLTVTLDAAHPHAEAARRDVQRRLVMPVLGVTIVEVDFVREITVVEVMCEVASRSAVEGPQSRSPWLEELAAAPGLTERALG